MYPPPPIEEADAAPLTRRDALIIGSGAAATAFLPTASMTPFAPGLQAAEPYEPAYDGDLPPFPDDWVDKLKKITTSPTAARTPFGTVLKEYRLIGCPMFGCTQRNVNGGWEGGWYYSFRAPRTGTVTRFMWQTQGARQHGDPADNHTNGDFGRYTVKFYAYSGFGSPKGSQLAQGRLTPGQSDFYPGWQLTSLNATAAPYTPAAYPSPDASHYGGLPETAELRGGLHVHAWLNRTLGYPEQNPTSYPYAGTAFVYIDVDKYGGGTWSVNAGDWIIAEFVNEDSDPTANFSADNNASSASAPRPGNTTHGSPLDGKLAIIKQVNGQPDTSLSAGRDIVPFFLLGYSDDQWWGQPWYYRGRSRYPSPASPSGSGSASDGLYDVDGDTGTLLPSFTARGPALLAFGPSRLRQVLTPPADYPGTTFASICIHAWRWTSMPPYNQNKRLGVRILRINTTNGQDTTTGLTKIWPKAGASGSNIFNLGAVGPFAAFPLGSFNGVGKIINTGTQSYILTKTPSNLVSNPTDGNPSLQDFEATIGILKYAKLDLDTTLSYNGSPVSLGNNYRYIIEIAAEDGSAYGLQLNTNTLSLINKDKDLNQGLATPAVGAAKVSSIDLPQIWPCGESYSASTGRNYNAAGKFYSAGGGSGDWVDMFDQYLPVCLIPSS